MFSEAIDEIIARTQRGNQRDNLVGLMNSTITEVNGVADFARSMVEDTITSTAINHLFTTPVRLKRMLAVEYPIILGYSRNFIEKIQPGRRQQLYNQYYYQGPDYFMFVGTTVGDTIKIAYMTKTRRFKYYTVGTRPAVFDAENEVWTYLSGGTYISTLGSDELDAAARDLVTNWILDDHNEMLISGATAKLLLQLENREKAAPFFANYRQLRDIVENDEPRVHLENE